MCDDIKVLDVQDHVKQRSMWLGTHDYVEDKQFYKQQLKYVPFIVSSFEEILVNILDQILKTQKINTINIKYQQDGTISMYNDGLGFNIKFNDKLQQWAPQIACTQLYSGNNFDDSKRITGGMNGCGIKLVNYNSEWMEIQTQDNENHYQQLFENSGKVINNPIITHKNDNQYTQISFKLFDQNNSNVIDYNIYNQIFISKIIMSITWLQFINVKIQHIYYNDVDYINNSINKLQQSNQQLSQSQLSNQYINILNYKDNQSIFRQFTVNITIKQDVTLSMINGMNVNNGDHTKFIIDKIYDQIVQHTINKKCKDKKNKTITKYDVKKIVNIQCMILMQNPQFNNQSKKTIIFNIEQKQMLKTFKLVIQQSLIEQIVNIIQQNNKLKIKQTILCKDIDKYQKAIKSGTKDSLKCSLFLAEGDSAMSMIKEGIKSCLDNDYYGIFSLQGVIVNSRKEINVIQNNQYNMSTKLLNNKVLLQLEQVLGLQKGIIYDSSKIKQLKYGKIVVTVDQDSDGVGNIFSLLLSHIHLFYPQLFKLNYIFRLNTPIVRSIFSNGKYNQFFSIEDYSQWAQQNVNVKHQVKYYKGLAGHHGQYVKDIFKNYDANVIQYQLDEQSDKMFNIYFGKDPNLRKLELQEPYIYKQIYTNNNNIVQCSDHLKVETKQYQLENIERKIPHEIDGLSIARRKVLYGSMMSFKQSNKECKVFQLCADIAKRTYYHHGDKSLEGTIIKMAQVYYGAKLYPYLLGIGQFGTRDLGGKDHGQSRYIDIKLNSELVNILFPQQDLPELQYCQEDGYQVEPQYFVPIIPTICIESIEIPSTGWSVKMYARNINYLIYQISNMIQYDKDTIDSELSPHYDRNNIRLDGEEYSFGNYKIIDDNQIIITELPYRIWTETYIKNMKSLCPLANKKQNISDKKFIYDIIDNSGCNQVKIIIYTTQSLKYISQQFATSKFNGIIKYFKLYKKITHNINCISIDKAVKSYKQYKQLLTSWYNERKRLYDIRKQRLLFIIKWQIQLLQNQLRFILEDFHTLNGKFTIKQLINIIEQKQYESINQSILTNNMSHTLQYIQQHVNDPDNYDYILNIKCRDNTQENKNKLNDKIQKKQLQYNQLNDIQELFNGQQLWVSEILQLQQYLKTLQ